MLWKQDRAKARKLEMVQVYHAHKMEDLSQASSLEQQPAPVSRRTMAILVRVQGLHQEVVPPRAHNCHHLSNMKKIPRKEPRVIPDHFRTALTMAQATP